MCYLDGKTKQEERMGIVDAFNNDPDKFVFLISTTAGGTGLNLTAANRVVVFDPHWSQFLCSFPATRESEVRLNDVVLA